jgi:1,2-diacylglycerol 3-beta-galactosyltransferase
MHISVQITTADESFATYQLVHNFLHLLLPLLFACCRCQYSFLCFLDSGVLLMQVQGFVTNMSEWMAACDCIITKAGPGTIAEAMIRGLPMLLFDFIAGQEVGNVSFVVENGAGTYCEEPKDIAKIIADWFGSKADELREMAANARKLAQPDAVFKIVHDLDDLVRNKKACLEQQTFVYHGLI